MDVYRYMKIEYNNERETAMAILRQFRGNMAGGHGQEESHQNFTLKRNMGHVNQYTTCQSRYQSWKLQCKMWQFTS